jgi:hypothetical protein
MQFFSDVLTNRYSKLILLKRLSVIIAVFAFLYACKKHKDDPVDCSGPAKSFAADVSPVIQASCANSAGCHEAGSNNGPGPLLNYTQVFNDRSEIREVVASRHMPLNGRLADWERNAIVCWIDSGAPNN